MTKSEKTRQYIIEKSAPIINKKGVSGTSLTDLMEATKLAKGGIYGNFESKEEICVEAFNYLSGTAAKAIDSAVASKSTSKEKLYVLLDYYQNQVASSQKGGCPLLNFGLEADDTNSAMRQQVAKAVKRSQSRISKIVEEGKSSGEFGKVVDSEVFAIKMFTMVEGAIFTSRVVNNQTAMKTIVDLLKKEIETF
jgi:AcrR family transcriptional regulator